MQQIQPDEIYNLAAQSHVKVSFDMPEYTAETDGIGTLRLLEALRICGLTHKTKILPSFNFGALWKSTRNSSKGNHSVLS